MSHTVETEDLVLLRSIDSRLGQLDRDYAAMTAQNARLVERLTQLESAFNAGGGRAGIIIERALVTVITVLMGYQTFTPPAAPRAPTALYESVAPALPIAPDLLPVATSTRAR